MRNRRIKRTDILLYIGIVVCVYVYFGIAVYALFFMKAVNL